VANGFTSHNSAIKWMEHAMCSAPVVASPTVYGQIIEHGNTGFLARNTDEWIRYLSRLIEKPRLRKEIGASARGFVLRHLSIHEQAYRWMQAYREIWQRTRA
jgi:glycosyltransferase involved in cell wall biosynthesis